MAGAPGPAFDRLDHNFRATHQLHHEQIMGIAEGSTHPESLTKSLTKSLTRHVAS